MTDEQIYREWIRNKFPEGVSLREYVELRNTIEFQYYLLRKRAKHFGETFILEIKHICGKILNQDI